MRRDAAEQAASKAERQGARLLTARARSSECRALANLGENAKAAAAGEEARRIFEETGDRGGLARTLHSMAEVPLDQGDLASAGKLYREALVILREIGDEHGLGSELLNLGLIAAKQGDLAGGLKMYGESYRSYQQAGDKAGMAAAIGNTGSLLREQGKLAEGLAQFRQALAYQAIGLVLADQGNLAEAYKMFQQALAIQQDMGEKSSYAETLRDMGQVWMQQGNLVQARKSFDEALSMQEQLGEMGSAAETRLALGELACNSGLPNEAEQLARAALQAFKAQNEPNEQILAAVLLSRSLIEQGKVKEAAMALEVPLKLAEKNSDLTTRLSLTLARANVLAATNDLVRAERTARRVLAEAPQDLFRLRLEAWLTVAEIQCKGRNAAQGRKRLQEVASAAKEKGFESMVRKAEVAGGR